MISIRNLVFNALGETFFKKIEDVLLIYNYYNSTTEVKLLGYIKAVTTLCGSKGEYPVHIMKEPFLQIIQQMSEKVDMTDYKNCKTETNVVSLMTQAISYHIWNDISKKIFYFDKSFAKHFNKTRNLRLDPIQLCHLPFDCFALDLSDIDERKNSQLCGMIITVSYTEKTISGPIYIIFQFLSDYDDNKMSYARTPFYIYLDPNEIIYENGNIFHEFQSDISKRLINYNSANVADNEVLDDFITIGLNFLSYISCSKPDILETPKTKKAKKRALRMNKPFKQIEEYTVGTRFGKAFALYDEQVKNEYEKTCQKNRHNAPRPHLVSAHWHGYWMGPQKSEFEYLWIAPYFKGYGECDIVIHECAEFICPKYSKGEELLYYLLESNNIPFEKQKYIPSTGKYFDCSATINGKEVYIEFDGQQHFRPVKSWDFNKTVISDTEKNAYCKNHQIPLIRIRYDQQILMDDIISNIKKNPDAYLDRMNPFLSNEEYYMIRKSITRD